VICLSKFTDGSITHQLAISYNLSITSLARLKQQNLSCFYCRWGRPSSCSSNTRSML